MYRFYYNILQLIDKRLTIAWKILILNTWRSFHKLTGSGRVFIVQLISAIDAAVRFIHFCLQQCRSVSAVLFNTSPSIFCLVVLLIFSRLTCTDVHFLVNRCPSSVTYTQAILIASVWSCFTLVPAVSSAWSFRLWSFIYRFPVGL